MNTNDALEDFLYGWACRYAPHVSHKALNELIDNTTDICRDAPREVRNATVPTLSKSDWDELLQMWAGLK